LESTGERVNLLVRIKDEIVAPVNDNGVLLTQRNELLIVRKDRIGIGKSLPDINFLVVGIDLYKACRS
jgi:hypothetical protein